MKGYSKPKKAIYRNYNYIVRYTDGNGKRTYKRFEKLIDAELFFEQGNRSIARAGYEVAGLPEEDKRAYLDASKLLKPYEISVLEAVREYVEARQRLTPYKKGLLDSVKLTEKYCEAVKDSMSLFDAYGEYLDALRAQGLSIRHIDSQEHRLKRFIEHFGENTPTALLDAKKIEKWIFDLRIRTFKEDKTAEPRADGTRPKVMQKGKELASATTRNNYRTALLAFFSYCKRKGYVKENPVDKVSKIKETHKEPEVFTVSEIRNILNLSPEGSDIRTYIAIGAFGGLRLAEAERLTWNKIDLKDKTITLDGTITKTSQRRIVKMSDNLVEWLLPYSQKTNTDEKVLRKNFKNYLGNFKKINKIKWVNNGLRHSSASYYLALIGDEYKTASQMGHNVKTLKTNYKGLVKEQDAIRYFNILPKPAKIISFAEATQTA